MVRESSAVGRWYIPRKSKVTFFVMGMVLSTASWARQPGVSSSRSTTSANTKTRAIKAGDVNLQSSRVYIHVDKTGLGHEHGVEGRLQAGHVHLESPGKGGELVFDMGSFVADTPRARRYVGLSGTSDAETRREVTANMLGADVLNVSHFPQARFHITKIRQLAQPSHRGLPRYQLDGTFTLHGVTKRISTVVDTERKNGWVHLRGSFVLLQTQYGMKPFTKMLGAVGVADRLEIWGDLWVADLPH